MSRRAPATKLTAIALFLIGIVMPISYRHWLTTRTFAPLDIPVSLSRGHIKTSEFYINLREQYLVRLAIDEALIDWQACRTYTLSSLIATHVTLFRNGQLINKIYPQEYSGGNYDLIAFFDADEPGMYSLDIEVLLDASCLNRTQPRVSVAAYSGPYHDFHYEELWLSGILLLTALGLWNCSVLGQVATRMIRGERFVIFESPRPQYRVRRSRLPLGSPFSQLPPFGLFFAMIASLVLLIVAFPMTLSLPSRGLWVLIRNQRANVAISPSPPLVLRIIKGDWKSPVQFYLNSRPVQFKEASSDLNWADVAQAIDTIHAAHGTVILLHQRNAVPRSHDGIKKQQRP
jgi:hypothetical protein